jgi:hypothetical protein
MEVLFMRHLHRRRRCHCDLLRDQGVQLIILLIPSSLCWMAANSESSVKDSATSHPMIRWCDLLEKNVTPHSRATLNGLYPNMITLCWLQQQREAEGI